MILLLHNRYRVPAGEERAVADLAWLLREHAAEEVEVLERDSALLGRGRAAVGMLRGGLDAGDVAAAVRRSGARVVHAHNVHPTLGWRALAAARAAGAPVVLHLHNYRLVCAVGTCFTQGAECTRCHGRDTRPGVRRRCRGNPVEVAVYGAGLALWQRRLVEQADAFVVPSAFARDRLHALGAPLGEHVHVVGHVVRDWVERSTAGDGAYALIAARLMQEKGVDVAIEACAAAGVPLVVAGDGPDRTALEAQAAASGAEVTFTGAVDAARLAELRAGAGLALVPSRFAETFGLAAAEAMGAGLPVVASRVGALPELVEPDGLVAPGDPAALAAAIRVRFADAAAGARALEQARTALAPGPVATALKRLYAELAPA